MSRSCPSPAHVGTDTGASACPSQHPNRRLRCEQLGGFRVTGSGSPRCASLATAEQRREPKLCTPPCLEEVSLFLTASPSKWPSLSAFWVSAPPPSAPHAHSSQVQPPPPLADPDPAKWEGPLGPGPPSAGGHGGMPCLPLTPQTEPPRLPDRCPRPLPIHFSLAPEWGGVHRIQSDDFALWLHTLQCLHDPVGTECGERALPAPASVGWRETLS